MKFRIRQAVVQVRVVGITTGDKSELGGAKQGSIFVAREQTLSEAKQILGDLFLYLWITNSISKGSVTAAAAADHVSGMLVAGAVKMEQVAEVIAEFHRQYEVQGGDAQLAEDMGLVAAERATLPLIEWKGLKGESLNRAVIRRHFCGHLSDELFAVYQAQYEAYRLNPLIGDCVPKVVHDPETKRPTVKLVVTLRAKLRIAVRTGKYRGATKVEWADADGRWYDIWKDTNNPPFAARVGVFREGCDEPIYGIAEWNSYAPYSDVGGQRVLHPFWVRFPTRMLGKCATSQALDLAIAECGGLYIKEELLREQVYDAAFASSRAGLQRPLASEPSPDVVEGSIPSDKRSMMKHLKRMMLEAGCPSEQGCIAIIDQVREQYGHDLEDDNFEEFARHVMDEVHRRHGRRR